MIVKICGFTNAEDVAYACSVGADMVGVIVDTPSPRSVTPERAKAIFAVVPRPIPRVAVMIPKDVSHAIQIVHELRPDYLQIHGSMSAEELVEVKKATGVHIVAAVVVPRVVEQPKEIIARAREVEKVVDFVLVDTRPNTGVGGGTGQTHDWSMSRLVRESIDKPLILSGGLNPTNVRRAIEIVQPFGVDVASGVELKPGKKDPRLVREFIRTVRGENEGKNVHKRETWMVR